uniref:Peptidase S1 domain-containing protein n=1 Tax=Electrophorus electricus TaxID=8005 RepID=A0A4W4E5T0_ELEEL
GHCTSVCGVASLNNKIVGGQNAAAGSWPWQVSIRLTAYNFHFCGGSLINSGWVLTAAHCFVRYTASQVTVYLGTETLEGTNMNQVFRSVTSVTIHPNYDANTVNNDLALLQLSSTVTFTPYVTPICLAASGSTFFNGTLSWVTGWGNIGYGVSLPSPGYLQEVQVPIIGNRQCFCLYGGGITGNMICAGALAGGKDPCNGDSGGPLVIKQGSVWIQAGIVSFGKAQGCAQANYPGAFTRVSQYQNWINQVITSNQPGFITYTSNGTNADLNVSCSNLPPATTVVTTTTMTTAPTVVCGNANLNDLSGAGTGLASAGMWPWMASVQRNGTHVCGGTLIAAQFVMSSADCFSGSTNASDWTVILGRLMQNGSNSNEVSIKVANITFSNTSQNNIAVLQLTVKPTLSNYIQPICVDQGSNNFAVNTQCWTAGWGSGGGAQQTLQQINTSIVSCDSASASTSICTQAFPLEQSERGGPLMCKVGASWFQAAVLTLLTSTANSTNSTKSNITNTNSTNSSSSSSKSLQVDVVNQKSSIMTFSKTSDFTPFLLKTVGSLPNTTSATTTMATTTKPSNGAAHLFLSVTSVILLSLPAIIQVLG